MSVNRRAFSLIEVLVAVALFGIAVSSLMFAVSNLMLGIERVADAPADDAEVRFVMSLVLKLPSASALEASGSCSLPDGTRMRWKGALSKTETLDLHQLDLELHKEERRGERLIKVRRLVYRPAWSEPIYRGELVRRLKESTVPINEGTAR